MQKIETCNKQAKQLEKVIIVYSGNRLNAYLHEYNRYGIKFSLEPALDGVDVIFIPYSTLHEIVHTYKEGK
jgi:hypothetical protein